MRVAPRRAARDATTYGHAGVRGYAARTPPLRIRARAGWLVRGPSRRRVTGRVLAACSRFAHVECDAATSAAVAGRLSTKLRPWRAYAA